MADYSLVPVDHQPDFGDFSLVPVDYQPDFSNYSLIPVDHDPFSGGDTVQQAQAQQAQAQTPTQPVQPQSAQAQPQSRSQQGAAGADLPDVGAPAIGGGGQFSAGMAIGNKAADVAGKVAYGMMRQIVTLPQRAIGAANESFAHTYGPGPGTLSDSDVWADPLPAVAAETALMMAGTGSLTAERGAAGALGGKLPPPDSAASVADKLDRYLLNPDHSDGGPKAEWFKQALGFSRENAADLAKQLIFDESQAVRRGVNEYGTQFNQTINVTGANGRIIPITTGWTIGPDGVPRLNTAFPGR